MHRLSGASVATRNDKCRMRRPAAHDGCSVRSAPEPLAVSRKPMARPDALVYELYGLTEAETRIVEGGR